MVVHDKVYQIRIKGDVLRNALKYCKDNEILLSEELRKVVEKFDMRYRKNNK